MQVDRFVPRIANAGLALDAEPLQSSIASDTKTVDTKAEEQESKRAELCYAGETVDSITSAFSAGCKALSGIQTSCESPKKALRTYLQMIPRIRQKLQIPKLLQDVQALSVKIHLFEMENCQLLAMYSQDSFREAYKTCRKLQLASGVMGESKESQTLKDQKLEEHESEIADVCQTNIVDLPDRVRRAIYKMQLHTLKMLCKNAEKAPSTGISVLSTPISLRLHGRITTMEPEVAPFSWEAPFEGVFSGELTHYSTMRQVVKGNPRYINAGVRATSIYKTYYRETVETSGELAKHIAIVLGMHESVKTSIEARARGAVHFDDSKLFKNHFVTLQIAASSTVNKLFSHPCNTISSYLATFAQGLELDIAHIYNSITFLSQFSSPQYKAVSEAQHALEAYLSCPEKEKPLRSIELLFNAAKKIWEQERQHLPEFGADVPKSFVQQHMVRTLEALHEILSQKGLESVEQDFQCQVWKELFDKTFLPPGNGLTDGLCTFILQRVTKALFFTKAQDCMLELVLHILHTNPQLKKRFDNTEIPALKEGVEEYRRLVAAIALPQASLELAVHVVEWFDSADTKLRAYAKAWSFFEDLLISDAPDTLKECARGELKKVAFHRGYTFVPELVQSMALDKMLDSNSYTVESRQEFFFRLLTSAIYNRDFTRQIAQKTVSAILLSEEFSEFERKLNPDVRWLMYENSMAKIREGKHKDITQKELDMLLSDASPILYYLQSWSHFREDEPVSDVLFKLVFLETKKEEKPFTSLCQQHMGKKGSFDWYETKLNYLRGWQIDL